jgi:hypothetical protein
MSKIPEIPMLNFEDDRVKRYLNSELSSSPKETANQARRYFVLGAALNVLALGLVASSLFSILDKNDKVSLGLIRLDGVLVHEAQDIRRDVLLRNVLQGGHVIE